MVTQWWFIIIILITTTTITGIVREPWNAIMLMGIMAIDLRNRVPQPRLQTGSRGHHLNLRVPQHPLLTGSQGHLLDRHVPLPRLQPVSRGERHHQPVSRGGILNPDQWDHLHPDQWDHPVLREAEGEEEGGSCPVLLKRNIRNTHFSYAVILAVSFFKEAHIITCIKRSICGVNNLIVAKLNHQIPII